MFFVDFEENLRYIKESNENKGLEGLKGGRKR